jgi:hypothetical protein
VRKAALGGKNDFFPSSLRRGVCASFFARRRGGVLKPESTTPSAPLGRLRVILLMSRPPLLEEKGKGRLKSISYSLLRRDEHLAVDELSSSIDDAQLPAAGFHLE